jgi:hypothetical protein
MIILHGVTTDGEEKPVQVDDEGRLVAVAGNGPGLVPDGGSIGQALLRVPGEGRPWDWRDLPDLLKAWPAFGHRQLAGVTVPTGLPATTLQFGDVPLFLNQVEYDDVTGRITPKVAGFWELRAEFQVVVAALGATVRIRVNGGTDTQRTTLNADGILRARPQITWVWPFNGTTDYLTVEAEHNQGAPVSFVQRQVFGRLMYKA